VLAYGKPFLIAGLSMKLESLNERAASNLSGRHVSGRCLCGAVELEIDFPAFWAWHDHSAASRRAHGAAYATYIGCWRKHARVPKGRRSIARFEDAKTNTGALGGDNVALLEIAREFGHGAGLNHSWSNDVTWKDVSWAGPGEYDNPWDLMSAASDAGSLAEIGFGFEATTGVVLRGTESLLTHRWREMDSIFQYASSVRWHRATDLPVPPP